MAAQLVASSAPSTSGSACAPPASAGAARSAACAWLPRQAQRQQRRQRRRRRHPGGGSGGSGSRIAASSSDASSSDKPEWFQALEDTAHLDDDVARLLSSAKNNPDAVRRRMQEGKLACLALHSSTAGWAPCCCSVVVAVALPLSAAPQAEQLTMPALAVRSNCLPAAEQEQLHCRTAALPHCQARLNLCAAANSPDLRQPCFACVQSRSSCMRASWVPSSAARMRQ